MKMKLWQYGINARLKRTLSSYLSCKHIDICVFAGILVPVLLATGLNYNRLARELDIRARRDVV